MKRGKYFVVSKLAKNKIRSLFYIKKDKHLSCKKDFWAKGLRKIGELVKEVKIINH